MDIIDFLTLGAYKGVSLGSTYSSVIDVLPRQVEVHVVEEDFKIVMSGVLEAHFFKGLLINLFIKTENIQNDSPVYIGKEENRIQSNLGIDEMLKLLAKSSIEWKVAEELTQGKCVVLDTEGVATIEFIGGKEGFIVNRIHLATQE